MGPRKPDQFTGFGLVWSVKDRWTDRHAIDAEPPTGSDITYCTHAMNLFLNEYLRPLLSLGAHDNFYVMRDIATFYGFHFISITGNYSMYALEIHMTRIVTQYLLNVYMPTGTVIIKFKN